jgi:hypothetical protein
VTTLEKKSAWFIGDGSLLIQAASSWRELGQAVEGVATREPAVITWAHGQGIPVVPPDELAARAAERPFDYLFSVVNLSILPEGLLSLPR